MSRIAVRLMVGFLVVLLAVPGAPLAGDPAAAGKGKKSRSVTRTFTNTSPITINVFGSASSFPSRIQVRGFKHAKITDVDLVLRGFGHEVPQDVDVLLVATGGRNAIVMSDVGNSVSQAGLTIRLDDDAAGSLPVFPQPLTGGTFRPTNFQDNQGSDAFDPAYAPLPSGNTALSVFDGINPNGKWQLFIHDDYDGFGGMVSGGWELTLTAKAKVKNKNKNKNKKA